MFVSLMGVLLVTFVVVLTVYGVGRLTLGN